MKRALFLILILFTVNSLAFDPHEIKATPYGKIVESFSVDIPYRFEYEQHFHLNGKIYRGLCYTSYPGTEAFPSTIYFRESGAAGTWKGYHAVLDINGNSRTSGLNFELDLSDAAYIPGVGGNIVDEEAEMSFFHVKAQRGIRVKGRVGGWKEAVNPFGSTTPVYFACDLRLP